MRCRAWLVAGGGSGGAGGSGGWVLVLAGAGLEAAMLWNNSVNPSISRRISFARSLAAMKRPSAV
jgi:hypothetical protein